jgi:hypothetical protein
VYSVDEEEGERGEGEGAEGEREREGGGRERAPEISLFLSLFHQLYTTYMYTLHV